MQHNLEQQYNHIVLEVRAPYASMWYLEWPRSHHFIKTAIADLCSLKIGTRADFDPYISVCITTSVAREILEYFKMWFYFMHEQHLKTPLGQMNSLCIQHQFECVFGYITDLIMDIFTLFLSDTFLGNPKRHSNSTSMLPLHLLLFGHQVKASERQ